ncbi:MAG: TonB-dependent receptor [Pseudomonadota bacterium]
MHHAIQRLKIILVFAIFVVPALFLKSAHGQQDKETLVVISTRTPAPQLAQNISVVDADDLNEIEAIHMQQVLSLVPGVSTQRGNGQESLPGIRSAVLTGAGACGSVLVTEDAIPVRGPAFCNVNELFDTHFEQAASVEVVRGPGSAFYGSNALTGMVNVNLDLDTPDSVSLELGSNDYVRLSTSLGLGAQDNHRVFLTLTDDGGYRDNAGYEQGKFSWRYQKSVDGQTRSAGITLSDLDQETAGFIVGDGAYLDETLARQNLDPEAFRQTRALRAWYRLTGELSGDSDYNLAVYLRDTDMDFLLHFLPGDPLEQNSQSGIGWQSSLRRQLSNEMSLTVGLDGDWSTGELSQVQDAPTAGSAFLQETIPVGVHYDYEVDASQIAAFAQLDWQLSDQWHLLAGIRGERLDYDYDNLSLDGRTRDDGSECGFGGCRYSRPADRSDHFVDWSPKLQLRYVANETWSWFGAVSVSARAPQATELYRLQRAQRVADLDSVRATNVELGFQYRSEAIKINASVYSLDLDNVIIRDADFFNIDDNRTASNGVELSANWQLTPHWSLAFAGTLASHKYDSDQILSGTNINGLRVDTAPETVANIRLKFSPNDRLQFVSELQHVDEYFLEPLNEFTYPGHEVVNFYASYELAPDWELSGRIQNVFDERYAKRADYTSFTDQRYFPGEPRTFFVTLKKTFAR